MIQLCFSQSEFYPNDFFFSFSCVLPPFVLFFFLCVCMCACVVILFLFLKKKVIYNLFSTTTTYFFFSLPCYSPKKFPTGNMTKRKNNADRTKRRRGRRERGEEKKERKRKENDENENFHNRD